MWDYRTKYMSKESVEIYDVLTGESAGILTLYQHDCADPITVFEPCTNWCEKFRGKIMPGYDMTLCLTEYVREGYPCFMTEYLPPAGREDSRYLMSSVGLDMSYDMWAFMIEQGRVCQDNWRVRRIPGQVYEHDAYRIKT